MGSISTSDALWGDFDDFDAKNEKYQRGVYFNNHMYPVNPDQLDRQSRAPLQNRVKQFAYDNGSADFIIDGCIRVRAPSDAFRQAKINQWTEARASLKNVAWLSGFGSLASAAGAFFLAANPYAMTACIVSSVALVTLTSLGAYRASQATQQIDLWNVSPAQQVAEQRSAAYKNGFSYVFGNNLKITSEPSKTGVLYPQEVQFLFRKYFPEYCSKLLNTQLDAKSQWMLNFLHHNPLSPDLISYALGQTPPHLERVSGDFVHLKSILNEIQNNFSRLKGEVRKNAESTISAYETKRAASLLPLQLARDHYVSTARSQLDDKLKTLTGDNDRRAAIKAFNDEKDKYELYYTLAATPINLYFDNQIQQTRVQRDNAIAGLNTDESQRLGAYHQAARDILQRAYQAWTQPNYMYQPYNFDQFNYFVPQPSAPAFDNLPNVQEQVFHQVPPPAWDQRQQSEYAAYLNYLRQQQMWGGG